MNIIDQARDALTGATPGPWTISARESVSGIGVDDWADDDFSQSNKRLAALAPDLADAVVRVADLAEELHSRGQRLGNSAYVHERAEGAGYAAAAAQLVAALEGQDQ